MERRSGILVRLRKEAAKDGRIDVLALLAKHGANLDETLPVDVGFLVRRPEISAR